jgi:hypothetical protein
MNVCWNLGKTCHALGDPSGALEMYEKGLNLSNHDEGATTEASNWTEKFSTVIENIQKQINHPEEIPNRD